MWQLWVQSVVLLIRKDPAIRVRVSKKMRMLLMILNGISPKLVGDTLFRLDLFSKRMKNGNDDHRGKKNENSIDGHRN